MLSRLSHSFLRASQFSLRVQKRTIFSTIAGVFKTRTQFKKEAEARDKESSQGAYVNIEPLQYGKDVESRTKRRLNWNVNRFEQRELEEVTRNKDLKAGGRRDLGLMAREGTGAGVRTFHSAEEALFFVESILEEGLTEELLDKVLDALLRDADLFQEKHLETDGFQSVVREISTALKWVESGRVLAKIAHFLDLFCIGDALVWVNLERTVIDRATGRAQKEGKKGSLSAKELLSILGSFAAQGEGSNEFYDLFEHLFFSQVFQDFSGEDLAALGYYFYIVHHGSSAFFKGLHKELIHNLEDTTPSFDLLRVLQTYCLIPKQHVLLMAKLEILFKPRLQVLSIDELSVCAAGFALSRLGSEQLFKGIEARATQLINKVEAANVRDLATGLLVSRKASSTFFRALLPKIIQHRQVFTPSDLCRLLYAYQKAGISDKLLAAITQRRAQELLTNTQQDVSIELIALFVQSFTSTRLLTREFQKLLEFTILSRLRDLQKQPQALYAIAAAFDGSGLVSKTTLLQIKKAIYELQVMQSTTSA